MNTREIKFRAWDTISKRWLDTDEFLYIDGDFLSYDKYHQELGGIITDYVKVMQYTGLKDKNGREVYEGDQVAPTGGYEDSECEHPSEVHWNEYNLQWEALCKTCASAVPLSEFDLHSVVGNVWEL